MANRIEKPPDVVSDLKVGDRVTFLNPTVRDPIHLEMRPHVLVAEVLPGGQYTVWHEVYESGGTRRPELSGWKPPTFGPFPRDRLGRGW